METKNVKSMTTNIIYYLISQNQEKNEILEYI